MGVQREVRKQQEWISVPPAPWSHAWSRSQGLGLQVLVKGWWEGYFICALQAYIYLCGCVWVCLCVSAYVRVRIKTEQVVRYHPNTVAQQMADWATCTLVGPPGQSSPSSHCSPHTHPRSHTHTHAREKTIHFASLGQFLSWGDWNLFLTVSASQTLLRSQTGCLSSSCLLSTQKSCCFHIYNLSVPCLISSKRLLEKTQTWPLNIRIPLCCNGVADSVLGCTASTLQ